MNHFKKISFILLILGVLFISGCAMQNVYDISSDVTVGSIGGISVTLEDARPSDDKKKSYGSMIIGASNYGIWTLGDESFNPAPLDALRERIMIAARDMQPAPKEIKVSVNHMIFQDNQQAYLLKSGSESLGPLGIIIAEAIHGQKFEMDYDKTRPFVIGLFQAEVTVDGKTRSVLLAKANNYRTNTDTEGRDKATRLTASQFFDELGQAVVGK